MPSNATSEQEIEAMTPIVDDAKVRGLTVGDMMVSNVLTVAPDDRLSDVHQRMRSAGVRHLPVVDADRKLVGVVSDRDVHVAWALGAETPVESFMNPNTHNLFGDTQARAAASRFLYDKIGCLPVVDADQKVIGIVTETDFVEIAHRALTLQRMAAEA
jgi:CBS domain-containing protein